MALERFAAIGRMTAGLAHDLRGPLHILASTAEGRLDALPQGDPSRADWELVSRSALHGARALQALVDFSKAGKPALKPAALDPVVEAALALLERPCRDRGVKVHAKWGAPAELPLDAPLLQGVFYNLINNALEAMPKGGALTLHTGADKQGTWATVKDTGVGMDAESLARLGERSYTTKPQGTGLGLYVSRLILQAHGARLSFASARGKGTTAKVRFGAAQ